VEGRALAHLAVHQIEPLIQAGTIRGGMVPKVRSAEAALTEGVPSVHITDLEGLQRGAGTVITL